jgi:hypothetical protein
VQGAPLTEEQLDALRALGYVEDPAPADAAPDDDASPDDDAEDPGDEPR